MTYLEIESLDYKAQIKNDFEKGYDDCEKGIAQMKNATMLYNEGYALACETGEKQSVGFK